MKFRIEAPGQPVAYGDYLDELEARAIVKRSGLVKNMRTVVVTPMWFWLRPEPSAPVSGNYTESEARERFQSGKAMWPQQELLMGPNRRDLTHVDGYENSATTPPPLPPQSPIEQWEAAVEYAFSAAGKETPLLTVSRLIVAGDRMATQL